MKKKVRGKNKKSSLVLTSATQGISLTAEIHLLRQRSILYLVDKSMTIREVARHLNTTQATIKSFFGDINTDVIIHKYTLPCKCGLAGYGLEPDKQ